MTTCPQCDTDMCILEIVYPTSYKVDPMFYICPACITIYVEDKPGDNLRSRVEP